jgi:hypothetical protein
VWPAEERDDEAGDLRAEPFEIDALVADAVRWPNVRTPVLPLPEALREVLSEAGTPSRSADERVRAEEVFAAARVGGLHRRVPKDRWVRAEGLEPNTPLGFEARGCRGCESPRAAWTEWFASPIAYTLAATPLAPILWRSDSTSLAIAIDPLDGNPPWTRYAIREWCTGQWVQRDGSLGAREGWLQAAEWRNVNVPLSERGRCRTFAVKASNGDGIETALGARAREPGGG